MDKICVFRHLPLYKEIKQMGTLVTSSWAFLGHVSGLNDKSKISKGLEISMLGHVGKILVC